MKKTIVYIVVFFLSILAYYGEGFAYTVEFQEGEVASMTGSNADLNFGVAHLVYGPPTAGIGYPQYDTTTNRFSGGFYIKNIGWAAMATGSYQVGMQCDMINPLTCPLTGTGWSDQIGELNFSQVQYIQSGGMLTGMIRTYAGDFSAQGIRMGNIAFAFAQDIGALTTSGSATLSPQVPGMYVDKVVTLTVVVGDYPQIIPLQNGVFSGIDLTLVGDYTFTVEVINAHSQSEGITTYKNVQVRPGKPTTQLSLPPNSYISKYCTAKPMLCPDGSVLSPTTLTPSALSAVADADSAITNTLKLRDAYGNRVNTGTLAVTYNMTVKKIQLKDTDHGSYYSLLPGDAIISSDFSPGIDGTALKIIPLGDRDITYDIRSYAPTNTNGNQVQLSSVQYNGENISGIAQSLQFTPPWEARIGSGGTIYTYTQHTFPLTSRPVGAHTVDTPNIIGRLQLQSSDPSNTYWSLLPPTSVLCKKQGFTPATDSLCKWNIDGTFFAVSGDQSSVDINAFYNTNILSDTGATTVSTYIHNKINNQDIIYMSQSPTTYRDVSRGVVDGMKIWGQSGGLLGVGNQTRTDFFNDIRKNIAMLDRNVSDFSALPYTINKSSLLELGVVGATNTKRSYIAYGQDIYLTGNIINPGSAPIAMIAVTVDGKGGKIIIDGNVTDVEASLVAERGIVGSGSKDRQLYIHGSIISPNTYTIPDESGVMHDICPYFTKDDCGDYNIMQLRSEYVNATTSGSLNERAKMSKFTPVVVEQDFRMQLDPPPGLIPIQ